MILSSRAGGGEKDATEEGKGTAYPYRKIGQTMNTKVIEGAHTANPVYHTKIRLNFCRGGLSSLRYKHREKFGIRTGTVPLRIT